MADEKITGIQIQVGLDAGKFEASGVRLTAQAKKITEAFNQISGLKTDQKLQAVERAVEKLGGVADLSAPQVARLRAELEKLSAAGAKIPKSLQLPKLPELPKGTASLGAPIGQIAQQQLEGAAGAAGSLGRSLSALGPAGLAAGAGVGVAVVAVKEMVDLAQRGDAVAGVEKAFRALAPAADDLLASSQRATQGLVSNFDLMQTANKGLLLGLPITADEMAVLGKTAVALGEAMGVGPTQAMQDLITGLGRGSAAILDNLGITVKSEEAYAVFAASIGKTSATLTEQEKKLAVYHAALDAASVSVGKIGEAHNTAGKEIERAKVGFGNLYDTVAKLVSQSPLVIAAVGSQTKHIQVLADVLAHISKEGLGGLFTFDAAQAQKGRDAAAATIDSFNKGIEATRNNTGLDLAAQFAIDPDFSARLKEAAADQVKLAAERKKAAEEAQREEEKYTKAVVDGMEKQFDALAKLRAKREDRSADFDAILGGTAAGDFESAKIQVAIEELGGVSELSARQVELLADKFFDLSKAGVDIPQGLGAITEKANQLNFDAAANSMAALEDQAIELIKAFAAFGQGPFAGLSGDAIDVIFGRVPPAIEKAKEATYDWHRSLEDLANLAQTLPGVFGKAFGSILSGVAGIGSSLKNIGGIGGIKDAFGKGIGGAISGLGAIGSIAGAAIGIGKSIIGLFKKDPVKQAQKQIAKDLGHGISEEFAKQAIDLSKALGISLKEAAKKLEKDNLLGKLSDLQGQAKAGAGQILSGLGGFGQVKGAADAQGRIFAKQFWAVVAVEGFGPAVEAFKATFDKLSPELQAAIPAELQNIFKFAENSDFKGALDGVAAFTEGFKGTVATIGLSKETLADYGQVAQAAFDQAKTGALAEGATDAEAQKVALQAIVPLLAAQRDAALQAGLALDANTQSLLDQADALGIKIPVDPMLQVVDILKQIEETLRAIGGIDVNPKVHITTTTTGDPIPQPGETTRGPKGFASGGLGRFSKQGTGAILHGFEAVLPLDDPKNFKRVFSDIVRFRPDLVADALGRIVTPALSTIPHFAGGGFTDVGGTTDTGGFGSLGNAFGGGSNISINAPVTINVQVEALGDLSAVGDQVAGAIDAEVPVVMDALARTIRREIATQ